MIKTKKVTNLKDLSTSEMESIKRINNDNLTGNGGTLGLSNILRYFHSGDIVLLAYENDEVVGYALIKKPMNEGVYFMSSCAGQIKDNVLSWPEIVKNPNALYIAQIAIDVAHQGCGIATTMIESMNDNVIVSNAKVKNTRSHKMHMKNGFRVIGGMYVNDEPYDLLYYREKCV